jgi:Na+/melibiose symporter-like transporter
MIDLRLLRRRTLATANLAALASSAALFGTLILLPFYMTAVLGFEPFQLALGITPIAASFMLVAPLAGRAIAPVGSDRIATIGFAISACGAVWMALAAGSQEYPVLLPGIIAFGVGLATSTSSITMTAIDGVAGRRLGVVSALPNISRYIGGALGAAILGAILHANLPGSVEDALGQVAPAGRDLVADGFRSALLVAAVFLLIAAAAASRMPRLGVREPIPAVSAAASLDAPVAR